MNLLDRRTFAGTDPDERQLLTVVIQAYEVETQVRAVVGAAGLVTQEIAWGVPLADIWPNILKLAAGQGRLRDLVAAVAADPNTGAWRDYFTAILRPALAPRTMTTGADPFGIGMVDSRAFIDRKALRHHLADMCRPNGGRVLRVFGSEGRGKTHSWYLISHLQYELGTYDAFRINLADWAGVAAGPELVARSLAGQLGWDTPPVDPAGQEDAAVELFLAWFKNRARQATRPMWLVFDGFVEKTTDDWARKLVAGIAAAVDENEAGRNVRVILLEYSGDLKAALKPLTETVDHPTVEDLRAFFAGAAAVVGQQLAPAAIDELLVEVFGPPPFPDPFEVNCYGQRAADIATEVFG